MNRFLFLDIDGVFWGFEEAKFRKGYCQVLPIDKNNLSDKLSEEQKQFLSQEKLGGKHAIYVHELNEEKVGMLAELVNALQIKVVLSSAWRVLFTPMQMNAILHHVNPNWNPNSIIDRTGQGEDRGSEIEEWCLLHGKDGDQFAAIDDNDDRISEVVPFVETDGEIGMNVLDVWKLMRIYGVKKAGKHILWRK